MGTPLRIRGGLGASLHAEDHGSHGSHDGRDGRDGRRPVVYLHGLGFTGGVWEAQVASAELSGRTRQITVDLRGHGRSDVPATGYGEPATWAADVRAVVEAVAPHRPVLVGWSYSGAVICDYLAVHGDADLSGIVLVGAASDLGTERALDGLTPEFVAVSRRLVGTGGRDGDGTADGDGGAGSGGSAAADFVDLCTHRRPAPADRERMLGWVSGVPTHVFGGMLRRRADHDATLRAVGVPVLVVHGAHDRVVRASHGRYIVETVRGAGLAVHDGVGHMPFREDPGWFAAALAGFLDRLPPA